MNEAVKPEQYRSLSFYEKKKIEIEKQNEHDDWLPEEICVAAHAVITQRKNQSGKRLIRWRPMDGGEKNDGKSFQSWHIKDLPLIIMFLSEVLVLRKSVI